MTNHELAAKLLGCEVNALEESGLCRSEELPVVLSTIQSRTYCWAGDPEHYRPNHRLDRIIRGYLLDALTGAALDWRGCVLATGVMDGGDSL